ncbi:hypothetical protein A0J61_08657 [Choanephora cucurbitarum]|uniref:DUF1279 domain-containing protein n=1 Tax=Choanephora cucurbitarum TaxID=101091 RepID=A0A1C7N2Q2_9FUNG|nr:hypothetical protein A0J61_08657 [Choanephora cucurbitarum]
MSLNSTQFRFYTTPVQKQEAIKINQLTSSPSLIEAAKSGQKTSKLKELTKKYGAVGVLVYLGVGCVDLGITFGVIQLAGLDKVKAVEKGVMDVVYSTGEKIGYKRKETAEVVDQPTDTPPSLASVFLLAYGIHKTLLLPVRLTITAAITPAVVRKLHQLGWARYFPRLLGAVTPKKPTTL